MAFLHGHTLPWEIARQTELGLVCLGISVNSKQASNGLLCRKTASYSGEKKGGGEASLSAHSKVRTNASLTSVYLSLTEILKGYFFKHSQKEAPGKHSVHSKAHTVTALRTKATKR